MNGVEILTDSPLGDECECAECKPNVGLFRRMIVCSVCGNKRCPHATSHRHPCSGSNRPGQRGSAYR